MVVHARRVFVRVSENFTLRVGQGDAGRGVGAEFLAESVQPGKRSRQDLAENPGFNQAGAGFQIGPGAGVIKGFYRLRGVPSYRRQRRQGDGDRLSNG